MTTCDHSESLYGRCVSCGMTWDQQAETRTEKRWTEMTADEQIPPWRWLVDEALLRGELDAWNNAAEDGGAS